MSNIAKLLDVLSLEFFLILFFIWFTCLVYVHAENCSISVNPYATGNYDGFHNHVKIFLFLSVNFTRTSKTLNNNNISKKNNNKKHGFRRPIVSK